MKKIDFLQELGILGDIRQRLGAEDEKDNSKDDKILKLTAQQLVAKHCGWHLGDETWAHDFISLYNKIKEFEEKIDTDIVIKTSLKK
jgi:hypothetical protein